MPESTNPAKRLHTILSNVLPGDQQKSMVRVWCDYFGIPDDDHFVVSRYLIGMADNLDEIKRLLASRDGTDLSVFAKEFPAIRSVISPAVLHQNRQGILTAHLGSGTALARLEFCSEALRGFYSEDALAEDDLNDLVEAAELLFQFVLKSKVPEELKFTFLEDLEKFRAAAAMYRIRGAKGLKDAYRTMRGTVDIYGTEAAKKDPATRGVFASMNHFLEHVEKMTGRATRIYKTLEGPARKISEWLKGSESPLLTHEPNASDHLPDQPSGPDAA